MSSSGTRTSTIADSTFENNSHAGQGAVLLDIGGDIGALVVTMPADLEGQEIEIRPVGRRSHLVHVAVLARPVGQDVVHCAVFGELVQGSYELYVRPDGPVELTTTVVGGEVTEAIWPVR